jgi:hypothetical protein
MNTPANPQQDKHENDHSPSRQTAGQVGKGASDVNPLVTEWLEEATEEYSGLLGFWRQRRAILKDPRLSRSKLKIKPIKFAVYVTIIPSLVFGICEHTIGIFKELPPSRLERTAQAVKVARDRCAEAEISHANINGDDIKDLPNPVKAQMRLLDPGFVRASLEDQLSQLNALARVQPFTESLTNISAPLLVC